MYLPVLQDATTYDVEGYKMRILPPDFTVTKCARSRRNEEQLKPLERMGLYYTPLNTSIYASTRA